MPKSIESIPYSVRKTSAADVTVPFAATDVTSLGIVVADAETWYIEWTLFLDVSNTGVLSSYVPSAGAGAGFSMSGQGIYYSQVGVGEGSAYASDVGLSQQIDPVTTGRYGIHKMYATVANTSGSTKTILPRFTKLVDDAPDPDGIVYKGSAVIANRIS